ncbi:MAG: Peptidase domain protein [Chthoniobacteraceae bacterium]|nr:Peptidase domain protein [Chthoniobacteraceae bacterium]
MLPRAYELLFSTFAFILGANIGSFLNVCIYRMPRELSVNKPKRSFCPSCQYQIPWYHNLPLITWLLLRGRCANCGAKFSVRYFGVELLTGLLFLAVWRSVTIVNWPLALPYWIFASLLVVATFIDFDFFIIPDEITWGGTIAGCFLSYFIPQMMEVSAPYLAGMASILPGAILAFGCIWMGNKIGGPIGNMRSPGLFGLWSLAAVALALISSHLLGAPHATSGLLRSFGSAAFGYLLLWGVVEAGKKAFGKKKMQLSAPAPFTWTHTVSEYGDDADLVIGDISWMKEENPSKPDANSERGRLIQWSEIFSRDSDQLILHCKSLKIETDSFEDVVVVSHCDYLLIDGNRYPTDLDHLKTFSGVVTNLVIPREAMGFGDVKFIAAIGAFLGWKSVLFTLCSASCIGAVIGVFTILIGKREWSSKIPFGPYLALGALIWFFFGPDLVAWYFQSIGFEGAM